MACYGKASGGGGGYTGPGDVVGGALAWYGLRAYNGVYASPGTNPAVDLVDQAGANPITIAILSNGNLDVASISTWVTAHSVTTIKVTKIYDQSGNAKHALQATLANMPALLLNQIGSLPALRYTGGASSGQTLVTSGTVTQAQPFTISTAYQRTSANSGNFNPVLCAFSGATGILGNFNMFAGSSVGPTQTDNAFHAGQGMFNGASSSAYVDGVLTSSLNPGAGGYSANTISLGGDNAGNRFLNGFILEAGLWGSDISANNAAMNSNQHAYWGF